MSNIKALDALRRAVKKGKAVAFPSGNAYYDAIDECMDAIEREVSERFMPLPCDEDGVPIKPGDVLDFDGLKAKCAAVSQERVYYWAEYGFCWTWKNADECHHDKPRTIEDVLREFAEEVYASHADFISDTGRNAYLLAAINETADEIRELMGVKE